MPESKQTLLRGAQVWGHGSADILVNDNRIAAVGKGLPVPEGAEIRDFNEAVIYPGTVNTHHHLKQSILKGMPGGINQSLNDWLGSVPYNAWPHLTPEVLYSAARIGLSELLRSGCTTCADHHYVYQSDSTPEMEEAVFRAADELGIRLVLCRGGSTIKGSHAGMNAAGIEPESLDQFLSRLDTTVAKHHDSSEEAMTKVAVAPTSLIHATPAQHLREMADFARSRNLMLHSHLLESPYEIEVAQKREGMTAVDYAESVGWLGGDVWFAHLVYIDDRDIARLGATKTGIAHCPTSNFRLGTGIAPVPKLQQAGARISIGVDGSAAAESGSMVNEMMQAWLSHRAVDGSDATRVEEVVAWASQGGAQVLGYSELGRIQAGQLADLAVFSLNQPRFMGVWEPLWAPVICGEPIEAVAVMVNGKWVVEEGRILGLDEERLKSDSARDLKFLQEKCA